MIYIAAMSAKQLIGQGLIEATAPTITASCDNDESALGHFMWQARQRWPIAKGWIQHSVNICPLPLDSGYYWKAAAAGAGSGERGEEEG